MTALTRVSARTRAGAPTSPNRRPPRWGLWGLWIALVIACMAWAVPFFFIFLTSIKSTSDIATSVPWYIPTDWRWENYARAMDIGDMWTLGRNSLVISAIKVPLGLFISALAAFALARLRFRWQRVLLGILAMGTLIPVQVALGPLFTTMNSLGLLNTKAGLILPYLAFGISYQIFILYGFFRAIPDELDEAARLDGARSWRLFWSVILPLSKPALAALFILDFVATWNEYPMALALLQTPDQYTIPLGVSSFQSQYGADYGAMNAYILLSMLPVVLVFLLFQRYFVEGAFAGAVKG